MKPTLLRWCVIAVSVVLILLFPVGIQAITSEYQNCVVDSSCVIGEFFFEDDYSPITGATCTYTARDPSGNIYVNAGSMTGQSDGWYSYSVNTTGATEGLYRGTVCCTSNGEQVCIEHSFKVSADTDLSATDISNAVWGAARSSYTGSGTFGENLQNPSSLSAADVWGYSTRSLTTFGSLAEDVSEEVWNYSSRSLSDFGDLISNIWSNTSRSLTTTSESTSSGTITNNYFGSDASETNYDDITSQLAETLSLLRELVDQPIIQTTFEDAPDVSLESKLQTSETVLAKLQEQATRALNSVDLTLLIWDSTQPEQMQTRMKDNVFLLGKSAEQPSADSIIDHASRLNTFWSNYILSSVQDQAKAALVSVSAANTELQRSGKSEASRQSIQEASKFLTALVQLIGTSEDSRLKPTAFGFLHDTQQKSQALREQKQSIQELLNNWKGLEEKNRTDLLSTIQREVATVNALINPEAFTTAFKPGESVVVQQKNQALSLLALISANERYLTQNGQDPVQAYWFEEGNVVFRFNITNPSKSLTRNVPVKYTLPPEVLREHVMKLDSALTLEYDPKRGSYLVSGIIELKPQESRTFSLEVEDIWLISEEQLNAMEQEAQEALTALEHTKNYAEGATLSTEIKSSLTSIRGNQDTSRSPDTRIRAYRENKIKLVEAEKNLDELVLLASQEGKIIGQFSVNGIINKLLVIGTIIVCILAVAYIGLFSYLKHMRKRKIGKSTHAHLQKAHEFHLPGWKKLTLSVLLFTMVTAGTVAFGSAYFAQSTHDAFQQLQASKQSTPMVLGATTQQKEGILHGQPNAAVVYSLPSPDSNMIHQIPENIVVKIKQQQRHWVKIQYQWGGLVYTGWVRSELVSFTE